MGTICEPRPVKPFTGILTAVPALWPEIERRLVGLFGAIDMRSDPYPFDFTRYYEPQMGSPLERRFVAFGELIAPGHLPAVKIATQSLEAEIAALERSVARPVNLDPGYLDQAKVVLASTKDFYHRLLLADGIYGEVTLHFRDRAWRSFPWTFPDFRSGRYDGFFSAVRNRFREQLAERGGFEPPTPVLPV